MKPSQDQTILLNFFAAVSHSLVNHIPVPAKGKRRPTKEICGENSPVLLARLSQDGSWRKMSQLSDIAKADDSLVEFSETWPRSGIMSNGIAFQLPPLVHLTKGIGSGLLPTITASEGGYNKSNHPNAKPRPTLTTMARKNHWPTPCAAAEAPNLGSNKKNGPKSLIQVARENWPIPTVQDSKNNGSQSQQNRDTKPLNAVVGGAPKPGLGELTHGIAEGLDSGRMNFWQDDWEKDVPRITTNNKNRVQRLKCLGNALVPQIPELIGRAIINWEKLHT